MEFLNGEDLQVFLSFFIFFFFFFLNHLSFLPPLPLPQELLETHPHVKLNQTILAHNIELEKGTEMVLLEDNRKGKGGGEGYMILEKDRRFRVGGGVGVEVVKEPLGEEELCWGWRVRVALDVARFLFLYFFLIDLSFLLICYDYLYFIDSPNNYSHPPHHHQSPRIPPHPQPPHRTP